MPVDRGLFSQDLIEDFRAETINYVVPLRTNSRLIDLRWLHWQPAFVFRDRPIRWACRHTDLGTVYLFDDPELRSNQRRALMRREADSKLTAEEFEAKQEQAGIVAILSDLGRPGSEIYDLYKSRHEVELAFDAMENQLDADTTYMQSDEASGAISSPRSSPCGSILACSGGSGRPTSRPR